MFTECVSLAQVLRRLDPDGVGLDAGDLEAGAVRAALRVRDHVGLRPPSRQTRQRRFAAGEEISL